MTQTAQIILVMFLWAICFPLITLGLSDAPHLTFAALRGFLAGGTLLLISGLKGHPLPKTRKMWMMLFLIGLGATTLGFFGMFHASEFISPGIATVLANTQPLMAAVLAYFVLDEHLNMHGKLGLFLGFLGVVLIAVPGISSGAGENYILGISYIFMAALGITVSNVLIRRIAGQIDTLTSMGWQLVLGSIALLIIAFFTEDVTAITWSGAFIISLFGLALPGTALAYWLWSRVLENTELNHANAFSFLVPIFGLAIGLFYDEQIGMFAAAGIVTTVLGIVLVNQSRQDVKTLPARKRRSGHG